MRKFLWTPWFAAAAVLATTAAAPAAGNDHGAVDLSDGTVIAQEVSPPKLNLSNAQREEIRRGVLTEHTEVEFQLKSTKPAQSFTPSIGAKLPAGVKPHSLPQPVLAQIPQLRDYGYVKMKDEVLIVNAMTSTIVDLFPETQPPM